MKPKTLTLALAAFITLGSGAFALANENTPNTVAPITTSATAIQQSNATAPTVTEFKPIQTITDEETGEPVDIYQYTGVVKAIRDKDLLMAGDDGKTYSVQLHAALKSKAFEALGLKIGDRISANYVKAEKPDALKDITVTISYKGSTGSYTFDRLEGDVSSDMEVISPSKLTVNNITFDVTKAMCEAVNMNSIDSIKDGVK